MTAEELGDLYEIRGRHQAAVAAYAKAQQPSATIWNKMGIAYQMFFNMNEALRCYKQALKLEPRNPHVLNNLGTVYEARQKYSQAEHYFRRAIQIDSKSPVLFKNLGTNLLMQHKHEAGAKAYEHALALDPHVFEPREGPQIEDPAPPSERGTSNYFLAQSCARAMLNDCALKHLRKAINQGAASRERITADHAFDALRESPAMQKLLKLSDE